MEKSDLGDGDARRSVSQLVLKISKEHDGEARVVHFSCQDGSLLARVSLSNAERISAVLHAFRLRWPLASVAAVESHDGASATVQLVIPSAALEVERARALASASPVVVASGYLAAALFGVALILVGFETVSAL